nr:Ni/Fe-hydrogenase, b-type cytochrome subunit [Propionibacterium sp.]
MTTTHPPIQVGDAFSVGKLTPRQLLALAASAEPGTTDPVEMALGDTLRREYPDLQVPEVLPGESSPARRDRRYSVARVRAFPGSEGAIRDLNVMRGDLEAVMGAARAPREIRSVLRRNAQMASMRGARPLAVASARVQPDGSLGPYRMQGFVALRTTPARGFAEETALRPGEWVRVNVWSALLRFQHWLNVVVVFVLSCTGYYIMDPFFGPPARAGEPTGYLMGWFRLVHFIAAFVWLAVGLTRVIMAFRSRDRYLRWPALWPLRRKSDLVNLGQTAQYYLFLRKHAPLYLGHNPLQQLTYTGVYLLGAVQMAVGFSLYSLYHQDNAFWALVATPAHWVGVPNLRLLHTMIMFALWAFVIAHIYLAVRADSLERHGGVSSMVNGGVWLRRGSKPADAPVIE